MKKEEIIEVLKKHSEKIMTDEGNFMFGISDLELLATELSGGEEKCPICGGKLHEVCYKCTKELCSPFRGEERSAEEILYTIELLEAEIDSLKDAYKKDANTYYSLRIVDHKRALKILKSQSKDEQKLDGDYDIHSIFKTKKGKKYKLVPIQQENEVSDEDIKKKAKWWLRYDYLLCSEYRHVCWKSGSVLQTEELIEFLCNFYKAMRDGEIKTN